MGDSGSMSVKMTRLINHGIPFDCVDVPIAGAFYFEEMGGLSVDKYWNESFGMIDEVMLAADTYFALTSLMARNVPINKAREDFDWFFLYQVKHNAQTIKGVIALVEMNCYFDCVIILRSLHSRTLQLMLTALEPTISGLWHKDPRNQKLQEKEIRRKLRGYDVNTLEHIYLLGNEIVHGNWNGLETFGFMEKGLFPDVEFSKHQIYIMLKYFIGISAFVGYTVVETDYQNQPGNFNQYRSIIDFLIEKTLNIRYDHMWFLMPEERFKLKTKEGKSIFMESFDFEKFRSVLKKHYIRDK